MFNEPTQKAAYDKGYLDGYAGRTKNNPYFNKLLASAWDLGYNSGLSDKQITQEVRY